jgi:hypothetical protein
MKKLLLLLLLLPSLAKCQVPPGGYGPGSGGSSSPSSLNTFFLKSYGKAPQDYGAFGDFKACYDLNVSGQPTAVITSSTTATLSSTALTSNVATYTFTNNSGSNNGPSIAPGQSVTVTGSTHNAAFNVVNQPVLSATLTTITVAITNANIGSAADAGTITTTIGCMNFNATRDPGKVIEIKGVGAAGALLSTTIASVQSATQATLAANATTNATVQKAWSCHDDTAALQSWQTDINNGIPIDSPLSGGTVLIHSGYVPGLFCTTKPIRLINPLGNFGYCGNCGFGTPEPFNNANAAESLYIIGNGAYRSGFVALSTFNWSFPNAAVNNAVFYYSLWNGPTLQNFAVLSPDNTTGASPVTFNTTANTGHVCGMMSDNNAHEWSASIEIENFHNTTSNLSGHCIDTSSFESFFEGFQNYNNDYNGFYGTGINPAGASQVFDGVRFDHMVWSGWTGSAGSNGNVHFTQSASGALYKNVSISNSKITSCDAGPGQTGSELLFDINVTQAAGDEIEVTNTTICNNGATNGFGVTTLGGANLIKIALNNVHIRNSAANAAFLPIELLNSNTTVNVYGGQWDSGATLTNLGTITSGSLVNAFGTKNNTGATAFTGSGATAFAAIFTGTAGTLGGPGLFTSGTYGTQANCAVNSVSPAACGAAASGAFVVPTTTTSYTVNTTAVTANSVVILFPRTNTGNLPGTPTCVVPAITAEPVQSAIAAGTSFTITIASTTGQTCWNYWVIN